MRFSNLLLFRLYFKTKKPRMVDHKREQNNFCTTIINDV